MDAFRQNYGHLQTEFISYVFLIHGCKINFTPTVSFRPTVSVKCVRVKMLGLKQFCIHRRSRRTIKVKYLFLNYQTNRLLLSQFGLKETVCVKIHACKMPLLNPSFLHAWIFTHMVFPFYTVGLEETRLDEISFNLQ